MSNYQSSPRFCGMPTFMRLPHSQISENIDVGVVGIPFDVLSSYRTGSRFAPRYIREISTTLKRYNRDLNVDVFNENINVSDLGDIPVVPGYISKSFDLITDELYSIIDKNIIPVIIGGDHGSVLPELRALHEKWGEITFVSFDAHRDFSNKHFGEPYGHGTTFKRALEEGLIHPQSSTIIGVRGSGYSVNDFKPIEDSGIKVYDIDALYSLGFSHVIADVEKRAGNRKCLITFDMDFVDPAYAPGVNTPEICGVTSREAINLIRSLANLNIVGCDLAEVNPSYDHGQITTLLAANILFEMISIIVKQLNT